MNDKSNLQHSDLILQDDKFKLLNNKRLLYPDILRTLAVFAVMMIHVCSYGFFNYDVSSFEWWVLNFYNGLLRWAVPIFVMVSGMFFLNPEKEVPIRKLYRKNIFRLVVALCFWGFLYQSTNVIKRIFLENTNSRLAVLDALKEFILGPAWFHLWFLYMIIGLYMFVPLFRIFTRNAKEEHFRYLFIMFIVWGSTYPFLQDLILCFDNSLKLHFCLKEFVGYFCYFVLGYYLSVRVFSKKIKIIVYVMAGVSVLFQIVGTAIIGAVCGTNTNLLHSYFLPSVVVQSIAVFLFVKEMSAKIIFSERKAQLINMFGKYSFGMYLVHDFFNGLFYRIGFSATCIMPILAVPIRTIITFILSFLVVFVLDKIPIVKKYCV